MSRIKIKPVRVLLLAFLAAALLLAVFGNAPRAAFAAAATDEEKVKQFLLQEEKGVTNAGLLGISNTNDKSLWAPYAVFDGDSLIEINIPKLKDDKAVHGAFDLSGCVSLAAFSCQDSLIARLNFSGCTSLKTLDCGGGSRLASLDVSGCAALETLDCGGGQLTALDVSDCAALKELDCSGNKLTILDVSDCALLEEFDCSGNRLTALDVSDSAALEILNCVQNKLTALDVSGCVSLVSLYCGGNQLTALDVSTCAALKELYCGGNKLASLNVSGCAALEVIYCYNNRIKSLALAKYAALKALAAHRNSFGNSALSAFKGLGLEYLSYTDNNDGLTYCVIRCENSSKTLTVKCIGEGFVVGRISGETIELYINPDEGYEFLELKDTAGFVSFKAEAGYYQADFDGETMNITAIFSKPGLSALVIGGIVIASICAAELVIFGLFKFAAKRNSFIRSRK